MENNVPKPKKKRGFPTAFTVLFIILLFAALLTWIVPAGSFDRLTYDVATKEFVITKATGEKEKEVASQAVLDKYHISVPLENFENKSVKKPIAIPNTYQRIESSPQGVVEILKTPVVGMTDSIGIIVFVLILGGIIGILNETDTFAAGVAALSRKTKGKEFLLVVFVSVLITIGGTTFGMAEETIAFYPILMPLFLASGYDAIVGISAIFLGSAVGTMFSTVNPFSVVIASNAAGIAFTEGLPLRLISLAIAEVISLFYIYRYAKKVKADPSQSIIADQMPAIRQRFLEGYDPDRVVAFDWRKISMLSLFGLAFPVMIWGVALKGWYFEEISTLFLGVAIICMVLSGLGEKKVIGTFIRGASDLIGVALIIAVARAINIVLDGGMISDTILNGASGMIANVNGVFFSTVQMILFAFLGIFIPSSSGLATLSMPIVAPLADVVHVGREIVVSAYNQGQGWMAFITPTGIIMATLELVDVTYDKWLKFVWPLMAIIGVFALAMLGVAAVL